MQEKLENIIYSFWDITWRSLEIFPPSLFPSKLAQLGSLQIFTLLFNISMTPLVEHSDAQNTSLNIWVKLELTYLWVDENKVHF